ncbi:hypothetical protein GQR58_008792 [Nymphon striatum]|nr:hypothetical protein GQR58_008792 [Nymphon striatum]
MDLVNLPDLVILRIIGLLDVDDILNLSKVHERFSELADSDHIWFNRCWNAISPFWAFVELPNKSDSESYMEYFMRCISKNSTQLKEVVFDFSELKIGDETWKRIDDYQFKNDVWKHAHWSGDVSMGSQTDSECDHYLHDILCFKRNGENKESITKLPGTMRDDLFRLSQVYGLPHETHRQSKVIGLEPHATIPSNGRFMDIFEDLPIFSEVMTTYYEQHKTFIFFMLITEFLEPIFKDLVERNVFSIHEVNGLLSFIIERSLLEITEGNLGMLYADEDSYHKFGKKFAKYELGYSKSHKYFDFKILKDLFSYLETLLISVLMEHDDNLNVTGLVEKREKFINMKLSEFYEVADRGFLYDTFSFFINLYKMNKYEDGSSKLIDKIENLLFHSTEIEGKEDCVRAYFLTDYLVVNGKDREHLEAIILGIFYAIKKNQIFFTIQCTTGYYSKQNRATYDWFFQQVYSLLCDNMSMCILLLIDILQLSHFTLRSLTLVVNVIIIIYPLSHRNGVRGSYACTPKDFILRIIYSQPSVTHLTSVKKHLLDYSLINFHLEPFRHFFIFSDTSKNRRRREVSHTFQIVFKCCA